MPASTKKRSHFVLSNGKAKSLIVAQFVRIARRERLEYGDFIYVCQQARKRLGLRRRKEPVKLPRLLSQKDLKRFFDAIQNCGNVQHEIMLKLLFYTAIRVNELVGIKISDIDIQECKIFINQGKVSRAF